MRSIAAPWAAAGRPSGRFGPDASLDHKAPPSYTQAIPWSLTLTVKLTPGVPLSAGSQAESIKDGPA